MAKTSRTGVRKFTAEGIQLGVQLSLRPPSEIAIPRSRCVIAGSPAYPRGVGSHSSVSGYRATSTPNTGQDFPDWRPAHGASQHVSTRSLSTEGQFGCLLGVRADPQTYPDGDDRERTETR